MRDKCSKAYFDFQRGPRKRSLISELHHDRKLLNSPTKIQTAISKYYYTLYSKDEMVDANIQARQECFSSKPKIVSEAQNNFLIQPFTDDDLLNALRDLSNGKVLGPDEIPPKFFKELWDDIKEDLVVYINTILAQGSLGSYVSLSNLSLIPKKGFLALLTNWRPLSILNTIYKLIAKALANRSKTFMPLWIRPSQTGFVKGRHILENIFTTQEAMYWAVSSQQNLALILLEFEKAYNRVSWAFLENASIYFGFSPLWISWIRALYVDASTKIIVNGQKNQLFCLGRSVRQGCPLAPYLFFVVDILGYTLDDKKYGVLVLKLSDNSFLTSIMFADDTSLYLSGVPKNLDRAFKILELYCSALGSKLNGHKTRCIWASSIPKTFSWGDNLGCNGWKKVKLHDM